MPRRRKDKDGKEILTTREQLFVEHVAQGKSLTQAALAAGYSPKHAGNIGHENWEKPEIRNAYQQRVAGGVGATTDEALRLLATHMRADIADFAGCFHPNGSLDLEEAKRRGISHLVKKVRTDRAGAVTIEFHDSQSAAKAVFEMLRLESGQPTAITAHRDEAALAKLRQEAEEALADALLATSGDREAALALLREHAPTLSGYVN